MKVYEYENCSTCKSALKFLDGKGVKYEKVCIVDQPPTESELKTMLGFIKAVGGTIKNLFNTSGMVYREQKIADKLKAGMSESEALKLLSKNGKLIKRPFLLTKTGGTVGFKPQVWEELI